MTTRSAVPETAPTGRLVLAGVVANAAVGTLFAWSLVAPDAARDVGLSAGGAAGAFAGAIVVFTVVVLGVGRGLRRLGPRQRLVLAALVGGAGLLLAALGRHPLTLYVGVVGLFGTANGLAYSVATTLAAQVPARRRGTATGIVVSAYAGVPVLLGIVGPGLVAEHGWRICTAWLAVAVAGLLLLAAVLVPRAAAHPQAGRRARQQRRTPGAVPLLWVVFCGGVMPAMIAFAHATPLATARGLDSAGAGMAVSALAGGNLAGRLLAGWLSDWCGRVASLAGALLLSAAALGCLVVGAGAAVVLGGCLGLGLSYGGLCALVPAATADLAGPAGFPAAYSRIFTGWGLAGLVGPVLGSWLLHAAADTPALLGLAVLPLLPAAAALLGLSRRWDQVGEGDGRPGPAVDI